MTAWWLSACLFLGGGGAVATDEDDSLDKITNDFKALANKSTLNQVKLKEDDVLPFIERCWKVYDVSEGEPAEFESLAQVLALSTRVNFSTKLDQQWQDAAAKLFTDFIDDDRMAQFVDFLPTPVKLKKEAASYVADLKSKSQSRAVKAALRWNALQDALNRSSQGPLDPKQEKALIASLEEFSGKFGDVKMTYGDETYGDTVKSTIFAIENLKIGGTAPEIAANDLDGVPFKLSDYRGKAVLLDFWGYW